MSVCGLTTTDFHCTWYHCATQWFVQYKKLTEYVSFVDDNAVCKNIRQLRKYTMTTLKILKHTRREALSNVSNPLALSISV